MIVNVNNSQPLNAFKFAVKNIGGKLYRINNLVNIKKSEVMLNEDDGNLNKANVREFKLVKNLRQRINSVISDDDATSEEDFSGNVSFLEDEEGENEMDMSMSKSIVDDFEDMVDIDSLMLFGEGKGLTGGKMGILKPSKLPKFKWTHFLSIPLHTNKEFVEKFEFFKKKLIEENFSDIDESLFQKNSRLHMTLCLFSIEENKKKEKLELISRLIKESEETIKKILDENSLMIEFDQLEIMGQQNKTRVLYTRPHLANSEKLRDVIDTLLNKFIDSDILTDEMRQSSHIHFNEITERFENEKLHVTLMNSTFLIRENLQNKQSDSNELAKQDSNLVSKSYFNGMKIIKRMKNFSFGVHKIDSLVLNEMRIDKNTNSYIIHEKFNI